MKFWRSVAIGSWVCVLLLAGCSYPPNKPVYGGTSGEPNQVISSSTYSSPNSAYQPPPTYSGPAPAAVSTPQSPNDAMVVQRVNQALRSSTFGVSPDSISVSAQNGTITLNGIVPSEQQRQMIDDLVRNTSGVINVNNQLQLGSSPSTVYHQASSPYPRP